MIKQAMAGIGLAPFAVGGLLLFVAVFVGVTIWVLTRSRKQVDVWSSLPLEDGLEPVEPRVPIATTDEVREQSDDDRHGGDQGHGGCGKCENCTCSTTQAADGLTVVGISPTPTTSQINLTVS